MKTIRSFDLGKADRGEAVRDTQTNDYLHQASLLIPAEFASTKDSATRRRKWRTRQAHKACEGSLDEVWRATGLKPLFGRHVEKGDGKWQAVEETPEQTQRRELLGREFPKKGGAKCGNPAQFRIKLLEPRALAPGGLNICQAHRNGAR